MNPEGKDELNYTATTQPAVSSAPQPQNSPEPTPETSQQPEVQAPAAVSQPTTDLAQPSQPVATEGAVTWKASEFIDHQKSAGWFFPLVLIIFGAAAIMYAVTRNILSTIVVFMGGVAFLVLARQKPRTLSYSLSNTGIQIGEKRYTYDDFRTFSIVQEGALFSVFLEPIKRFMPPISIYFAQEDGEKIFDILASHIPHQEHQPDAVDRFMSRIRF